MQRDPRAALSLLAQGRNPTGLQPCLIVSGQARIGEGGAAPLLQRWARTCLGPAVEFPSDPFRSRARYVIHMAPRRFAGIGPWSPSQD